MKKEAGSPRTPSSQERRVQGGGPYNAAFAQSIDIVQDFWNVPVYNELIASTAQQLGEALDGKKSSKDALSELAAEHEKILSQAQ